MGIVEFCGSSLKLFMLRHSFVEVVVKKLCEVDLPTIAHCSFSSLQK